MTKFLTYQEIRKMAVEKKNQKCTEALKRRAGKSIKS